ncbi:TrkH family potassium uptake protein [Cecembia lonarensis]|uniref:Ktr system potassium uptake protein B n=1 Tax=Cecembia lonarensis (strain CCUG 58316 / KCTC 22772 / LW9) TaxID=1225176 RepID=K1LDQ0_CECL9|nr:potassium transporter TrkG [Cecembia lonarensis]EKB48528.1 Ktr system potassium uptake protein B [Cecembia lonarensis LW9]
MKSIFNSPDDRVILIKKVFDRNNRMLQILSLIAFGILVYDLGFRENVQDGVLGKVYYVLLLFLSVGFIIRLFSKSEKYSIARYLVEVTIILFLLIVSLANFGAINIDNTIVIGNLPIKSIFVNLLIFILFLIELSKLSLSVNQLKIHPALVFILSFLVVIAIGTGMLLLPNATKEGISLIDALFTSTSAVCVTGLIVLDTSSDFTFLGQFIILILFQVGGLGMMTFTSFFGFFFKGSYSLQNQLFLKDYINEDNIGAINSTLLKIILFTLITEGVAALLIFKIIDQGLFNSTGDQVFFSVFHAISGFCNAGFSILGDGLYEVGFREEYTVHLIIAFTIILGGIGFPVVLGYFNYLKHVVVDTTKMITKEKEYEHAPRVVNVNIRLIVYTTGILLLIGFVTYWIFESNHTLAGLSGYGKFVTAFFGTVTPRTAGFNTVDMSALALPTVLIYLILMWIGASPGSTGGGLKTSTIAVAVLNVVSITKGKDRVEIFKRQIGGETLRKAFAVIVLSFLVIGFGVFLVLLFDPQMPLISVAFEIFSAFSTVGLSLGITGDLSTGSKIVVTVIMFLGRVGTLTVLVAFVRKARTLRYKYPEEGVFIT